MAQMAFVPDLPILVWTCWSDEEMKYFEAPVGDSHGMLKRIKASLDPSQMNLNNSCSISISVSCFQHKAIRISR